MCSLRSVLIVYRGKAGFVRQSFEGIGQNSACEAPAVKVLW